MNENSNGCAGCQRKKEKFKSASLSNCAVGKERLIHSFVRPFLSYLDEKEKEEEDFVFVAVILQTKAEFSPLLFSSSSFSFVDQFIQSVDIAIVFTFSRLSLVVSRRKCPLFCPTPSPTPMSMRQCRWKNLAHQYSFLMSTVQTSVGMQR